MAYFIYKMKPKIFLFENVEGLLNAKWNKDGQKGEIFQDVLNTFQNLKGYTVKYKLVHAKDYGVPQNRPRILLVGIKNSINKIKSDDMDAVKCGFLPDIIGMYPYILMKYFSDHC